MKKTRAKKGLSKGPRAILSNPEISFVGSYSNMAGGFDLFEMGSVRRIQRVVKRSDFLQTYCIDITSMFELTNAQQVLLKAMLGQKEFFDVFKWTEEVKVALSTETGISVVHVDGCFRSLVNHKKLIRLIKRGTYRFNTEFLFTPAEVKNADFLGMNLTYVFENEGEKLIENHGKRVTIEHINALIEIHNQQNAREKQIKNLFEDERK